MLDSGTKKPYDVCVRRNRNLHKKIRKSSPGKNSKEATEEQDLRDKLSRAQRGRHPPKCVQSTNSDLTSPAGSTGSDRFVRSKCETQSTEAKMYSVRKLRPGEIIKQNHPWVWRARGGEFAVVDQDGKIHRTTNRHNHTTFEVYERKHAATSAAAWHNKQN